MVDTIFVIDEDYPRFQPAWNDLLQTLRAVGDGDAPRIESFRFSLSGSEGAKWSGRSQHRAVRTGWHFRVPTEDSSLANLSEQCALLEREAIRYRVLTEPFGKADSNELRFDPGEVPTLALPFEDSPKNALRFFAQLEPAFVRALGWKTKRVKSAFETFFETSLAGKPSRPSSGFEPLLLSPNYGSVGRHDILKELWVRHETNKTQVLLRLLTEVDQLRRPEPVKLFLQFFSNQSPRLLLDPSHLYEQTFEYPVETFDALRAFVDDLLQDPATANGMTDIFLVVEKSSPGIGASGDVTYTVRRTKAGHFEIRINAAWSDERIEPETAVLPVEKSTGLTWARLL